MVGIYKISKDASKLDKDKIGLSISNSKDENQELTGEIKKKIMK